MISGQHSNMLDRPLNKLGVRLSAPHIASAIKQLHKELKNNNISFRPEIWISDDWFSPDGHPGFAIPFYLFTPQLISLENFYTQEVEGYTRPELMKLLRHETAHAMDNAFGLRMDKRRQKLFGLCSVPYPKDYLPNKKSNNFVTNLSDFYAQSHPEEDFAETFAVWLDPGSNWQKRYISKPVALEKLLFIDQLMHKLKSKKEKLITAPPPDQLRNLKGNLRDYYLRKRKRLGIIGLIDIQKDLHKIFTNKVESKKTVQAAKLIKTGNKILKDSFLKKKSSEGIKVKNKLIKNLLSEMENYCLKQSLMTNNQKKAMTSLSSMLQEHSLHLPHNRNRIIM
jgi:hypothetical protein